MDNRVGLIDGVLPSYRLFILVHQNDLLTETPSPKVHLLINVWDRKQSLKTNEDGITALGNSRNKG
jgi:hypothetical protein